MTVQNSYYFHRTHEETPSIFCRYRKENHPPSFNSIYACIQIRSLNRYTIHKIMLVLKPSKKLRFVRGTGIFTKHKSKTVGTNVLFRDRYKEIPILLIVAEMFWRSGGVALYF